MLVIRFTRIGKKNQPAFKIIVNDKRKSCRAGKVTEVLGFYNPITKKKDIKKDRLQYWLKNGAKPSESIHNLLVGMKLIEGKKIPLHSKKKGKEGEKPAQAPVIPSVVSEQTAPVAPATPAPAQPEKPKEPASVEGSVEAKEVKSEEPKPAENTPLSQ